MKELKISTFGVFSITTDDVMISETDNHSRKIWSVLSYLIYNRNRIVSRDELLNLLWADKEQLVNSPNALKVLLHRVRNELDNLFDGAGKQLVQSKGSGYCWNNSFDMVLDFAELEKLKEIHSIETEQDLALAIECLSAYKGDFLEKLSSEMWVMPIQVYYRNLFLSGLGAVLPIMIEKGLHTEAINFCKIAVSVDPVNEVVHELYMEALYASGKVKEAISLYQQLSDRLLSDYGIMPTDRLRTVYRKVTRVTNEHVLTIDMLQEQLKEDDSSSGALICEYDFFRVLYHSMARSMARTGVVAHVALLSATSKTSKALTGSKLEKVMEKLEGAICLSLRRGDSAAKCSATQFVVLLPRANYENSCMVCERIIRSYYQKNSYSDANFRYEVCALQPDDKENFQWIQDRFNK